MTENNPMTVGGLMDLLRNLPSEDYHLPIKVYALTYTGMGVHDDSFKECDCNIDSVNKISELGMGTKGDFFRIEIS